MVESESSFEGSGSYLPIECRKPLLFASFRFVSFRFFAQNFDKFFKTDSNESQGYQSRLA